MVLGAVLVLAALLAVYLITDYRDERRHRPASKASFSVPVAVHPMIGSAFQRPGARSC